MLSRVASGAPDLDEANLDTAIQRCCDPMEHVQGVPGVVVILQSRDDGVGGTYKICQLPLRQLCLRPKIMDLSSDLCADSCLLQIEKWTGPAGEGGVR